MTRILFPFVGDTLGGSHLSALTLADGLKRQGWEILIGAHQAGRLTEYLEGQRIEWVKLPDLNIGTKGPLRNEILWLLGVSQTLYPWLRRKKIDLVHTHDGRMHRAWFLSAKRAGVAHVWHQRSQLRGRRYGWYARLSSRVVTISEYCRSTFPKGMKEGACVVVNPVAVSAAEGEVANTRAALLGDHRGKGRPLVLGWVANWLEHKRPLLFVDIAAEVSRRSRREIRFAMFGEPREPMCSLVEERIAERGLSDKLQIMGMKVPIAPWLAACDGLVATAVQEGLGRTLIEAMMLGVPVVATADGGHLEIIRDGENGRLVPPDDVDAFASAVLAMLEEHERTARMAGLAKEEATRRFSVDTHVEAMIGIYESVLKRPFA